MSTHPPRKLFDRIYRRHGHRCPMSTLGGRLGWAGVQLLGRDGGLQGAYFIETCALDGIRETTGCCERDGTLRIEERGEHRLVLFSGAQGVEATLTDAALSVAGRYRLCSEALERDRPALSAKELASRQGEREEILQAVLEELWTLPDSVLLRIRSLTELSHA